MEAGRRKFIKSQTSDFRLLTIKLQKNNENNTGQIHS
jgi:hypothetical protein